MLTRVVAYRVSRPPSACIGLAFVDALGGVCESVLLAYVVAGVTIGLVLGTPGVLGFGLGRFWVAI